MTPTWRGSIRRTILKAPRSPRWHAGYGPSIFRSAVSLSLLVVAVLMLTTGNYLGEVAAGK
ncbi:MAG: hypothetical protein WCL49_08150 [bacterium]